MLSEAVRTDFNAVFGRGSTEGLTVFRAAGVDVLRKIFYSSPKLGEKARAQCSPAPNVGLRVGANGNTDSGDPPSMRSRLDKFGPAAPSGGSIVFANHRELGAITLRSPAS